jgi:hypothetical protein
MTTDLILSRRCRHVDWCTVPKTSIECCRRCGFSLTFTTAHLEGNAFVEVQHQPQPGATFEVRRQTSGTQDYRYEALDLDHGRQVRILVLKAGSFQDPLRCELEHVNLQHGPNYEAVSYTWADAVGDDSLTGTITHNTTDQSISITKNCEMALRRLRKPRSDRRLWVDAVCIDQSNVQERNHQVKNMIAIFRSALRVLVYLGQGDSTLHRLVDYIADDTAGQLPQVLDFVSLFQSRWFHRVWVLQEIAVAKDTLVIYGEKLLSWNDVLEHSNLYLRLMAAHNLPLVIPPVISFGLLQTTSSSQRLQGVSLLANLWIHGSARDKYSRVTENRFVVFTAGFSELFLQRSA